MSTEVQPGTNTTLHTILKETEHQVLNMHETAISEFFAVSSINRLYAAQPIKNFIAQHCSIVSGLYILHA